MPEHMDKLGDIRLKTIKCAGYVIRMGIDRMTIRIWGTMGRAREKTGTTWAVELRKDCTEIGKKWGNKYPPINMPEFNREVNRTEEYQ